MNDAFQREVRASRISSELLSQNLVFGTAWFWTLPEVHNIQTEIDLLTSQFRRYIGARDR